MLSKTQFSKPFRLVCVIMVLFSLTGSIEAEILHVSQKRLDGIAADLQFETIGKALSQVAGGDTVMIHGGVYREQVAVEADGTENKPIIIRSAEGENVIITGADELKEWKKESASGVFSTGWDAEFVAWTKHQTHPSDEYHRLTGRCEQVFVNGYGLKQVLEKTELGRGTFYVNTDEKRLYARDYSDRDLAGNKVMVEASRRGTILKCMGKYITIKGLRFRYAANAAQHGAVEVAGDDCKVEDCVFEYTNSCGAKFTGKRMTVRRCTFQHNGQLGFGAGRAHDLHIIDCLVQNNNTKGFDRGWEAGGNKIVLTRDMVIEHSIFRENRGHGIWFDIGNEQCVVRNCFIVDNEDAGIFYEISYGLSAHDNVIVGNGFAFSPGNWGANAGISLSSSPGCVIERNLLLGNKEGFSFREQERTTPLIRGGSENVWNHNNTVNNNVFAYNRDAQVWGWFDIDDQRHWPASMQEKDSQTPGLALEQLALRLDNNIYVPGPGQGLFNWGVPWKRHKKYTDLEDVKKELSFSHGSGIFGLSFRDISAYDLRVDSQSVVIKTGCYPKGDVPGVKLGEIGDKYLGVPLF